MTSDRTKVDTEKNEWQKFLDTGKGGQKAVPNAKGTLNRFGKARRRSSKQQGAIRRSPNG